VDLELLKRFEDQTEFDVVLTAAGAKKINAIKLLEQLQVLVLKRQKQLLKMFQQFLKSLSLKKKQKRLKNKLKSWSFFELK